MNEDIVSMDQFLAAVAPIYPEVADMDFMAIIELVADKTNNGDLVKDYLDNGWSIFGLLADLVNSLNVPPSDDFTP